VKDTNTKKADDCKSSGTLLGRLEHRYADAGYHEVDGIYIIYQGYVDIVDPRTRNQLHQIQLFETFGESKAL